MIVAAFVLAFLALVVAILAWVAAIGSRNFGESLYWRFLDKERREAKDALDDSRRRQS